MLLVAATLSLIIGIWKEGLSTGWYEGVTIYIAVVIIVSVTAVNDYMKEKQFQKLMDVRTTREMLVQRQKPVPINTKEIVVGDILIIEAGDQIPADAILVECSEDIMSDESNITGESRYVRKTPLADDFSNMSTACPFLLEGSLIRSGQGKAVVCAVGLMT